MLAPPPTAATPSSRTASLGVRVGWQISDDQLTWPVSTATPTAFALATLASKSAEGLYFGAVWEDVSGAMTAR